MTRTSNFVPYNTVLSYFVITVGRFFFSDKLRAIPVSCSSFKNIRPKKAIGFTTTEKIFSMKGLNDILIIADTIGGEGWKFKLDAAGCFVNRYIKMLFLTWNYPAYYTGTRNDKV